MGVDLTVCVEAKVANKWEIVPVYVKRRWGEYELALPYNGRNYDLFGWLRETFVPNGVPDDASPETKELREKFGECGVYGETCISLANLRSRYKDISKKEIVDYTGNGEPVKGKNPVRTEVKYLIYSICCLVDVSQYYTYDDDNIRIIYWFDS